MTMTTLLYVLFICLVPLLVAVVVSFLRGVVDTFKREWNRL